MEMAFCSMNVPKNNCKGRCLLYVPLKLIWRYCMCKPLLFCNPFRGWRDWSKAHSLAVCGFHSDSSISCLCIHLVLMQRQFLLINASVEHGKRVCGWKYSAMKMVSVFELWPGWTMCYLVGEWGSINLDYWENTFFSLMRNKSSKVIIPE